MIALLVAALNPVLLVHGIDDSAATWSWFKPRLEAAGFTVDALSMEPNDGKVSLARLAEQVRDRAETLRQRTGSDRLDVVAFSLGTIVSRYWLQRLGGAPHVDRFVSISGPHHGTVTGYLRWNPGGSELRYGSALITDLNQDWEKTARMMRVTSIYTPFDLMIFPALSSRLPLSREVTVPVGLHPWMLSDQRVLGEVVGALREPAR